MGRNRLPLLLPGAKKTEILERVVTERLGMIKERALRAYPDGVIVGTKKLSPRQMFDRVLLKTMGPDWPLLMDPDYLTKYQAGVAPPPVSPFWLDLLSIPESWKKIRDSFVKTYEEMVT